MNDELLLKIKDPEDSLVERKPPNCNDRELRKELVAFANSVNDDSYGVIFIGVSDDGKIIGVENPDEKQKKVRRVAESDCYPPVKIESYVLCKSDKFIVAIVIRSSNAKPHFSGPAYVRRGSECVNATEQQYENLINSRSDKCREILKHEGALFSVITVGKKLGDPRAINSGRSFHQCKIISCSQHSIRLQDVGLGQNFSEPLDNISVTYDEERHRPMLLVQLK